MLDKATVAAVARELCRSWDTVNDIAVAATTALLLSAGRARLDGVDASWSRLASAVRDRKDLDKCRDNWAYHGMRVVGDTRGP
jgi:hypothetical protein